MVLQIFTQCDEKSISSYLIHNVFHKSPIIITSMKSISVAYLECVLKLKTPKSDRINARALITVQVLQGFSVQSHNSPLQAGGSVGLEVEVKTKLESRRSFVFSLSCILFLEDGGMGVGGQHFETVLTLKMADGKGSERGRRYRALDTLPFPYPIIHHHRTVQYSPVRFRSASRLPTLEAGFP